MDSPLLTGLAGLAHVVAGVGHTPQLPLPDLLIPLNVLLHNLLRIANNVSNGNDDEYDTDLVLHGDEAVHHEHLPPELPGELPHAVQQTLHLTLLLSLQSRNCQI